MTQEQKIIRAQVGLLELAKQLGNVSQACKMMGYSRDSFKAIPTVPHHLAGLTDIAELLGQFQQPDLRSDNLLLLCHRGLPHAGGRAAVPALVRTASRPPAPASENQLRLSG